MPTSAVEYIIVGVKGGKAVFNAGVNIVHQNLDDKLIESVIVAEKVSSVINGAIRQALLDTKTTYTASEEHISQVLSIVKNTLSEKENLVLDRVNNMYKEKDGVKYLQACVPNHVTLPLKTGNRTHPTEKPVMLLQYLLSLYSQEHDLVLDPFAESGSTGEACLTLNRVPLLVEREKEFYEKAKTRILKFI